MYSGTTLRNKSGRIIGAHQKIDRVARRLLNPSLPKGIDFPSALKILHFEGYNGPDGIKRKSPAKDEPWHYIDPGDTADVGLLTIVNDHIDNLAASLKANNQERAAFEAAWLAHAIVDGLTPAHHYPLEDKIEELWGYPKDLRLTVKQKNIIVGDSRRDTLSKNWQYWGAKGVWTTHFMFEFGFATTIAPLKLLEAKPSANERVRIEQEGFEALFVESIRTVYSLKMYETFHKKGWNSTLARQTRETLAPTIVKLVTLAWYYAAYKATKRQGS